MILTWKTERQGYNWRNFGNLSYTLQEWWKIVDFLLNKSSLENESYVYIKINEEAFNFLNNIKANDEKWDEFNNKKNIERIRSRVLNKELSLTEPKQRKYEVYIDKISNNEFFKMGEILEDNGEYEEEKSEEIDKSYDKCEDTQNAPWNNDLERNDENFVSNIKVIEDKSSEFGVRRSFYQFFVEKSKSIDNNTSFADK